MPMPRESTISAQRAGRCRRNSCSPDEPEPWQRRTPCWAKMMAWDLGGNWPPSCCACASRKSFPRADRRIPAPYPAMRRSPSQLCRAVRQLDASKLAALALPGLTEDAPPTIGRLGQPHGKRQTAIGQRSALGLGALRFGISPICRARIDVMGANSPGAYVVLGQ